MDIESYRNYCISKPHVTEDFPFGENVLVFRVGGKIFTLFDVNDFSSVNLKCDPEQAVDWREQYSAVLPGYHMNKKHWNTVLIDGSLNDRKLKEMIDHSYDLVKKSLPKKLREQLG
jgi:predicted DNA-binding protein (MmcQ/YjbR family)